MDLRDGIFDIVDKHFGEILNAYELEVVVDELMEEYEDFDRVRQVL